MSSTTTTSKQKNRTQKPAIRRSLHVVIDRELDALINAAVTSDGLSTSAIVCDALRSYFQLDDPRGRGWSEGSPHGSPTRSGGCTRRSAGQNASRSNYC